MAREYKKTLWVNEETPLNASNLNKIEEGIEANTNDLAAHEADIAKIDEDLKQTKIDLTETKEGLADFEESVGEAFNAVQETFENFREETNNILDNINPAAFKSIFDVENSDEYYNNNVIYEVPRFYKGTLPCDNRFSVPVETINITWLDNNTTLGLILLALMVDGEIYSPDNFCWPNDNPQSRESNFNIFTFNNGEEGLELSYSYDEENGPYIELYLFTLKYNGVIWDSNNGWNKSSSDKINVYGEVEFDSGSKLFGDLLSNIISLNGWPDGDEGRDYYVCGYNGWVKLNGCNTKSITPSIQNLLYINLVDDVYSAQILEVPYMFKGKFSFPDNINWDYTTLVNVGKVYINKQLDKEIVNTLLAYALLVDDYISSVAPFRFQQYKEDGCSDKALFLEYETEEDYYAFILAYDETNGYLELSYHTPSIGDWILYDSIKGWWEDCPDYIEFNHDMAPFESSLFFAILSDIFSFEPFEQNEDLYSIGCNYFVNSQDCWWQKLNGGESTSNSSGEASSASSFVDIESLTTRQGGTAIPQTGKVDAIYFNTSLFNEDIINIISKLEVGETMPQYYIFVSDDMSLMLYVGIQAQPTSELGEIDSYATYYIAFVFEGGEVIVWDSEDGWDPNGDFGSDLENGFNFGVNLIAPEGLASTGFPADGHCGDQNDLLVSIVSTEKGNFEYVAPKEIAVGDKDKVYRTVDSKGEYSYHQIKNDGWEHFGGNIIPVDKLSDVEKLVGTTITKCEFAGPVIVYINKTLTNEQVQELCSKVCYDNGGEYYVCGNNNCAGYLKITDTSLQETSVQGEIHHNYQIYAYDYNTGNYTDIWSTYDGWYDSCPDSILLDTNEAMPTSVEPLSEEYADEFVGKYNNLIKDLFSATPFKIGADKKAIYRVKEDNPPKVVESAVPAGGSGKSIGKIFINLNLSNEEMLELFKSVTYAGASNDYKFHNVIHSVGKEEDSNWGFVETYNLHIIKQSDTEYELTLTEWVIESGNRYYNRICLYSTIDGWNPDISNYVNEDGSLRKDISGTKAFDYEYCTFGDVGLENDKLIDLIYNQTIEETYDYAYYQYTSNGWERYGVGVIPVKELPSAELPPKYIAVPNEGEICKIIWNQSISPEKLLNLLEGLPEEFWKDKDGNEAYYYIFNLKVVWNGDPNPYFANANIYLRRESNSNGIYTYYLGGQDGSSFFTIFYISNYQGWRWENGSYIDLLNNIFDNQANNNGQWHFMSEDLDGEGYKYGHYNHLLMDFVYANNPEYDPNYKPAISQTALYRVDTNEGSKYYNFNGTNWTEVGTGAGGLSQEDMDAILQEAKTYTDEMRQSLLGEGISETFDTLKEIQNWIETDGVEATELATELAKKQNKLTAGNGISISEDGTISLNIPLAETEKY